LGEFKIATFARKLAKQHRPLFASDPLLRKRADQGSGGIRR
jgi:hypothetical protein